MEIPAVNRISDFEVAVLPILPSLPLHATFSISGIEKIYSIWTWGALILAVIASFGTIITRLNFAILHRLRHTNPSQPISVSEEDDFSDIDDDEDDTCSIATCSSVSDDEEEEDDDRTHRRDGGFSGLRLRCGRSFAGLNFSGLSWSDFASPISVVKLWDNLALGLDDSDDEYSGDGRAISVYDMNMQKKINSFLAGSFQVPAAATSSRSTILAVIVSDGRFYEIAAESGCDSAVTRCCSAVRSYLL